MSLLNIRSRRPNLYRARGLSSLELFRILDNTSWLKIYQFVNDILNFRNEQLIFASCRFHSSLYKNVFFSGAQPGSLRSQKICYALASLSCDFDQDNNNNNNNNNIRILPKKLFWIHGRAPKSKHLFVDHDLLIMDFKHLKFGHWL